MAKSASMSGRVAEVFYSIQGEGATAGTPAVFARLQACAGGCAWCAPKSPWDADAARAVDLAELLAEMPASPCRHAVVTGGEPLQSVLFAPLVATLLAGGWEV